MTALTPGTFARRPGERRAKWHAVESVIAGAAITRCGRRMEHKTNGGALEVSAVEPLTRMIGQPQLCRKCGL